MKLVVLNIAFLLAVSILCAKSSPLGPSAGPPSGDDGGYKYDLEIQKVELVNDTDYVVFEGLKVKRYNKTCKKQ